MSSSSAGGRKVGRAFVVGGDASTVLVPFEWDGVRCLVPVSELRHLSSKCLAVQKALAETWGSVDRVQNNAELRARTVRCTCGCWDGYERIELSAIAEGDKRSQRDWEEDGVRARADLVRKVRSGLVLNAHVEPE